MTTSPETLVPQREHDVQEMLLAVKAGKDQQAAESFLRIVNATLDTIPPSSDLQSEVIERYTRELDAMIEPFLEHPEASIRAEFALLTLLSGDRSLKGKTGSGTMVTEFGTRNDTRDAIDHHFRVLEFPSGNEFFVDQTTFGGRHAPTTIMLQDGDLSISQEVFRRKKGRVQENLDPTGEEGRQVLKDWFKDTIYAIHLIYTRSAEESEIANADSKKLLLEKIIRQANRGNAPV